MAYRIAKIRHDSNSSQSDVENSDNDSDSEKNRGMKKMRLEAMNANTELPSADNISTGASRKKPNNIWADVVVEQQLSQQFVTKVQDRRLPITNRGPESYNFHKCKNNGEQLDNNCMAADTGDDSLFDETVDIPETLVTSQNDEKLEKPKKHRNGRNFQRGGGASRGRGYKRQHSNDRQLNQRQKFPMIYCFKLDPQLAVSNLPSLAALLARALCEPKIDLMEKSLRFAGVEKCQQWLIETEKIERKKGLMTADNFRRRSPGGIFLTLLKDDKELTDEQKEQIIGASQQQFRAKLKAKRQIKNKSFEESLKEMSYTVKSGGQENMMDVAADENELKEKKQFILEEILAANTQSVSAASSSNPDPKTPPSSPHRDEAIED